MTLTHGVGTKGEQRASVSWMVAIYVIGFGVCGLAAWGFFVLAYRMSAHHAGFWAIMAASAVYGVTILAVALGMAYLMRRAMRHKPSPAGARYARRFSIAMGLYVIALIVAIGAYIKVHPTGVLAYVIAIAPTAPLLAVIAIMALYLREETDEFQRAVAAESGLWATGGLLAIATVWGFLEIFRLAPHVGVWVAFPLWSALLGPAQLFARWRYR